VLRGEFPKTGPNSALKSLTYEKKPKTGGGVLTEGIKRRVAQSNSGEKKSGGHIGSTAGGNLEKGGGKKGLARPAKSRKATRHREERWCGVRDGHLDSEGLQ